MQLFCELNEEIQLVAEAAEDGKKNYFIEGVFLQGEITNRNGRMYPAGVLRKEISRYNESYITKGRAFGELGHPDGPTINLERVSHMIKSLKEDGNNFIGKAKILDTPYGQIVKNLIDEGAKLGVSSRGMGSLKESGGTKIVQDDFYLATAADIVADPSAPDAFVNGIMEGKEFYWEGSILKEKDAAEIKETIKRAPARKIKAVSIEAFERFIKSL